MVPVLSLTLVGCSAGVVASAVAEPLILPLTVRTLDESGEAVVGAVLELPTGDLARSDDDGLMEIPISGPVGGVIHAEGYLPEPVVISSDLGPKHTITLYPRQGPDGVERTALHFGGDTMMGRRYLEPTRDDIEPVDPANLDSVRSVVSAVAPLFGAADLSTLNLETVIGEGLDGTAGKRYLLTSPPEAIEMLHALGVDLVALGNNHIADFGDLGIDSTLSALSEGAIGHVGAGANAETAAEGVMVNRVGFLSYLVGAGGANNDALPVSGDHVPEVMDEWIAWQYEPRPFRLESAGLVVENAVWLAGDAWRWYQQVEPGLTSDQQAEVWHAIEATFPELQDWAARSTHGGAAEYSEPSVTSGIEELRSFGAQLVVVQLHALSQYTKEPTDYFRRAARVAVDAGADVVISHGTHVLGGFEWYRDGLIAYGLGNLVFDQDLFVTFETGFLRVVAEGREMVAIRFIPMQLVDYRPIPVTGEAAARIAGSLLQASQEQAVTIRTAGGDSGRVADSEPSDVASGAVIRLDGNAVVVERGTPRETEVSLAGERTDLPAGSVVRAGDVAEVVDIVGHDLLCWGSFDEVLADGAVDLGPLWAFGSAVGVDPEIDAYGDGHLRLRVDGRTLARVRPVARLPINRHVRFDADGLPMDAASTYSIRLRVRALQDAAVDARLDLYHYSDRDPSRYPLNQYVRRWREGVDLSAGDWRTVEIAIPDEVFAPSDDGFDITAVMLYLEGDHGRASIVWVDDVEFLEWRQPALMPSDVVLPADVVRSGAGEVTVLIP